MSNKPVRTAAVNSIVGFVAAAVLIPLSFKLSGFLLRTVGRLFVGIFKFSTGRKLIGEAILAGLTALLTNEAILDRLFGERRSGKR